MVPLGAPREVSFALCGIFACSAPRNHALQTEVLGCGLMIGSAFAVVLPEGFEALHTAAAVVHPAHSEDAEHHSHAPLLHDGQHGRAMPKWAPGLALLAGFLTMLLFDVVHHAAQGAHHTHKVRL